MGLPTMSADKVPTNVLDLMALRAPAPSPEVTVS